MILIPVMLTGLTPPAGSADAVGNRSGLLTAAVHCRSIAASPERLACYDRTVRALDEAEQTRDVIVIDRAQVRQTRKTLFGLTLPRLAIFGDRDGKDDSSEEVGQIESTIARADVGSGGGWTLTLADGARWRQTDDSVLGGRPRPGDIVVIRRGVLGSFKAAVAGQPAIKVRREN